MKPLEDSEDFTAGEAEEAIPSSTAVFVIKSADEAAKDQNVPIRYELRRRKPHMYCRAIIGKPDAPDKVLVFRLDWLKEQNQDGM